MADAPTDARPCPFLPRVRHWRDQPIGHYLTRAASLFPDAVAVIDGDTRLTFADVDRDATTLAAALHSVGIGADDVVSFQLPNRPKRSSSTRRS